MKYVRRAVYLGLAVYTLLALFRPKKMYVDRFMHDMHYVEWALLQPFPTMYSSESILESSVKGHDSVSYPYHHPMKHLVNHTGGQPSDSVHYKLTVRYRGSKSVKKYTIFKDSLFTNVD